eukprot:2951717-Amphidinium_carterae.1
MDALHVPGTASDQDLFDKIALAYVYQGVWSGRFEMVSIRAINATNPANLDTKLKQIQNKARLNVDTNYLF